MSRCNATVLFSSLSLSLSLSLHYHQLLDILQDYMISQGYTHCRLDGSTKIEERARLVHSFNTDSSQFIFLISKKFVTTST